jgi:hypothetical protein
MPVGVGEMWTKGEGAQRARDWQVTKKERQGRLCKNTIKLIRQRPKRDLSSLKNLLHKASYTRYAYSGLHKPLLVGVSAATTTPVL